MVLAIENMGCRLVPVSSIAWLGGVVIALLHTGVMFWFIRKKFVGSYFFLSSTSRLYVAP